MVLAVPNNAGIAFVNHIFIVACPSGKTPLDVLDERGNTIFNACC